MFGPAKLSNDQSGEVCTHMLEYREHDQQFWEEELEDFVPQRIFDAHFHLFRRADMTGNSE